MAKNDIKTKGEERDIVRIDGFYKTANNGSKYAVFYVTEDVSRTGRAYLFNSNVVSRNNGFCYVNCHADDDLTISVPGESKFECVTIKAKDLYRSVLDRDNISGKKRADKDKAVYEKALSDALVNCLKREKFTYNISTWTPYVVGQVYVPPVGDYKVHNKKQTYVRGNTPVTPLVVLRNQKTGVVGDILINMEVSGDKIIGKPIGKDELIDFVKNNGWIVDELTWSGAKLFEPVIENGQVVRAGLPVVETYAREEGSVVKFESKNFRLCPDKVYGYVMQYTGFFTNENWQSEDTIAIPAIKHCDRMFNHVFLPVDEENVELIRNINNKSYRDVPLLFKSNIDEVLHKIKMPDTVQTANMMFPYYVDISTISKFSKAPSYYFSARDYDRDKGELHSYGWYMPDGYTCLAYVLPYAKTTNASSKFGVLWYSDSNGDIYRYITCDRKHTPMSHNEFCNDIVNHFLCKSAFCDTLHQDSTVFNGLCVTEAGLNVRKNRRQTVHEILMEKCEGYAPLFVDSSKIKDISLGDLSVRVTHDNDAKQAVDKPRRDDMHIDFVSNGHTCDGKNFYGRDFEIGSDIRDVTGLFSGDRVLKAGVMLPPSVEVADRMYENSLITEHPEISDTGRLKSAVDMFSGCEKLTMRPLFPRSVHTSNDFDDISIPDVKGQDAYQLPGMFSDDEIFTKFNTTKSTKSPSLT